MKAKYLYSMGNNFYHISVFEYRGKTYEVEYSSGYTTFSKDSAKKQHIENQKRIDDLLDNPIKEEIETGTFDIDTIWDMLEQN